MAKHAILSPSSAHRWMSCPGAPAMEQNQANVGSTYADKGTAAHFLAAECLRNEVDPVNYFKRNIVIADGDAIWGGDEIELAGTRPTFEVDEAMVGHVRQYVSAIREYAGKELLLVEQSLPIGHLTGEEGATGSGDAIVVAADELQVHDLKYGHQPVSPEGNKQLMLYALGAMKAVESFWEHPFKRVLLVIHQPRAATGPKEWTVTIEELQRFAETVKQRASHALACFLEVPAALVHHLRPSDEACRWCSAKADCPKLADFVQEQIGADFEAIATEKSIPAVQDSLLATKMQACDLIEDWIKAVRGKVEAELFAGRTVLGYKLVEGKRGNRQWRSDEEAEQLLKSFRLKQEEMYDFKLISPTTAEKVLKESPKRWSKAQALIVQKEGRASVAPVSDRRPEWHPKPVADEFSQVQQGEELL